MIAALLGEGSSDRALLPILRWVLERCERPDVQLAWVDTRSLPAVHRTLKEKVATARALSACEILFVHRDADTEDPGPRYAEIRDAAGDRPHVAVVPIRETEAWMLIDPVAIACAAGRPRAASAVALPPLQRLERLADPKRALHDLLISAQGAAGRRASRFYPEAAVHRVADLVEDWSPLLGLSAFQRLEADTRAVLLERPARGR